jgi:ABC-type branched-subunit amino acid transport system substrate-binding protein
MTANELDRRSFVRAAGALLLAGSDFRFAPPRPQDALRIAFVAGAADGSSAARGVTLGVEEAARTGELMGRRIELVTADSVDATRNLASPVAALIGGFDEAGCRALGEVATSMDAVFINVGCRADALRAESCGRGVFHVEASARMYAGALAARGKEEGMDATEAALWHPSLERFGAGQLNDRYRARFGAEMDGAAWAGWMAVKALWEASLRARTVQGAGLRAYLECGGTQFDGHKGWPLSFRAWDHQLRQPLYLVAPADGATRVVGEVPARSTGDESPSRDLLDALDADASASACGIHG